MNIIAAADDERIDYYRWMQVVMMTIDTNTMLSVTEANKEIIYGKISY